MGIHPHHTFSIDIEFFLKGSAINPSIFRNNKDRMNNQRMEDSSKIIEDIINLQIGNTNKSIKVLQMYCFLFLNIIIQAIFQAKRGNRKVEVLLTMKTYTNDRTIKTSKREMAFHLRRSTQEEIYRETIRDQIGKSHSYVEVNYTKILTAK